MFITLVAGVCRALNGAHLRVEKIVSGFETDNGTESDVGSSRARQRTAKSLLIAALLSLSTAAYAHSWYPKDCCHGADCRPVPCDELVETRNGLMWRGVVPFTETQVKPSQDQFCHVCAKEQRGTILPYLPLCVFVAPSS
jgi:hypothetical protein